MRSSVFLRLPIFLSLIHIYNDNDLEMIRYAGIGVAMGNGTAKAREAADYIADSIDEDGLWKTFVHLGLIDDKK